MRFSIGLCVSLVLLIGANAKNLDAGPQVVTESTASSTSVTPTSKSETTPESSLKNQKRFATREILLYLTPNQIKALKAGKGLVSAEALPEVEHSQHANLQQQPELVQQQLENINSATIEQGHSSGENLHIASEEPLIQRDVIALENQQEHDHWRYEQAIREEQSRLRHYYQELNKARLIDVQHAVNLDNERIAWVPYNPEIQIRQEHRIEEPQQIEEIVNQNQFHSQFLSPLSVHEPRPERVVQPIEKPLLQLQYSPKYNDQKNAIIIENILRARYRHELERQNAFAKAQHINNSPAVVVQEEVKVRKPQQVLVDKEVKVAVPSRVVGSHPVALKVPHIYPVPQQVIKHVPASVAQGKRIIAEGPVSNNVYFNLDRPYFLQGIIPEEIRQAPVEIAVQKDKKVALLRPLWNH